MTAPLDPLLSTPHSEAATRLRSVFSFLKEYSARSELRTRTLDAYSWRLSQSDIPTHGCIDYNPPRDNSDAAALTEHVLRVRRPRLSTPPGLPERLAEWVEGSLEDPAAPFEYRAFISVPSDEHPDETVEEAFDADADRVAQGRAYRVQWNAWAKTELPARKALKVFEQLFFLHARQSREGEAVELVVADGILVGHDDDGRVHHPVLFQRAELYFDSAGPEFTVRLAERGPELDLGLLRGFAALPVALLNAFADEVASGAVSPTGGELTNSFLRRLVQQLDARGLFLEDAVPDLAAVRSPRIYRHQFILLRKRVVGFRSAFEKVIERLDDECAVPVGLRRLVGVEGTRESSDGEGTATSPWADPPDILFCRPANQEQIQIARELNQHGAVLVQGPPGTGKSHTIANLIGHLLAQGKRILVTSHTTKALRVLRGHLPIALQPLCVSLLDTDTEGRKEMERSVGGILNRLSESSVGELERAIESSSAHRTRVLEELEAATRDLVTSRAAETTSVIVGGEAIDPSNAARWLRSNEASHGWIPGRIVLGSQLTLSAEEIASLYRSNETVPELAIQELAHSLPSPQDLLSPAEFRSAVAPEPEATQADDRLWVGAPQEEHAASLEEAINAVGQLDEELTGKRSWEHVVIKAGAERGSARRGWELLAADIESLHRISDAAPSRFEALEVEDQISEDEIETAIAVLRRIGDSLAAGRSIGRLTTLFRRDWSKTLSRVRVRGKRVTERRALLDALHHLELRDARTRVMRRYERMVTSEVGLEPLDRLSGLPEDVFRQLPKLLPDLLSFWETAWTALEQRLRLLGLRVEEVLRRARSNHPFADDFSLGKLVLREHFLPLIGDRLAAARAGGLRRRLRVLEERLGQSGSAICRRLVDACRSASADAYSADYEELRRVTQLQADAQQRLDALERLSLVAPGWAAAVSRREGDHGSGQVPGDVSLAWRCAQIRAELDRRALLDEVALKERIEILRTRLSEITVELVDAKAWLAQHRRTSLPQRQALQTWADLQVRIGRGTGRRAAHFRNEAQSALLEAHAAVPIWIMPLSRVVESFAPSDQIFDVVIVDEASQMDIRGLLTWYIAKQIVVVGDHEQVSPSAVGEETSVVQALAAQYLDGFRYASLFDGKASVYHLARTCFGGTITLREHFRCVPDIIEFSNHLSYAGEIQPLRESRTAPRPHVVEYRADGVRDGTTSAHQNRAEARIIAACIDSILARAGESPPTIGAIALVGDEQAALIEEEALALVGSARLLACNFLVGNPAQFQGDERDIMLLSMVDRPSGTPLRMRRDITFQQRYNVAASRARNQLWLVHSLEPQRDLQPGDLRLRLIEHVRDPQAMSRAAAAVASRSESPFEREVAQRLVALRYDVEQQVRVGKYRIDMVVSDGKNRIALECDGDLAHPPEKLADDLLRQSVLERVGWRFVRIRGSVYYRDPDGTIDALVAKLDAEGIHPILRDAGALAADSALDSLRAAISERLVNAGWMTDLSPPENVREH